MSAIKTRDEVLLTESEGIMTVEIQDALNSAKRVVFQKGIYITGPLEVPSDTTVIIEKSALIKFVDDFESYPPIFSRWEGVKCWCMHPCLLISNAENVEIKGEGSIDGSGEAWWKEVMRFKGKDESRVPKPIEYRLRKLNPDYMNQPGGGGGRETQFLRPPLVQIYRSKNVTIEGIKLQNSPFWTLHPLFSKDIRLKNIRIANPAEAPNTDGIDIESSSDVTVEGCFVNVGDDGIALKSGSGIDGIRDGVPTEKIAIRGCTVLSAHGGVVIGSETAGGVKHVSVENCLFDGTDRGVRIKTRRGRGGVIHHLNFKNIVMKDNLCPFVINMYYGCGTDDQSLFSLKKLPITEETPEIYGVKIEGCVATGCESSAGVIVGLPERPVFDCEIKDCNFKVALNANREISESAMYAGLTPPQTRGFWLRNVEIKLDNLKVDCIGEPIIIEEGVTVLDK